MQVEVETRESLANHIDSLDDITPYPIRRIRTRCYTTSHEELYWRKFEIGPLYRRALQSGATAVVAQRYANGTPTAVPILHIVPDASTRNGTKVYLVVESVST